MQFTNYFDEVNDSAKKKINSGELQRFYAEIRGISYYIYIFLLKIFQNPFRDERFIKKILKTNPLSL